MNARDSGYCGGCEEYIKGIDLLISNFRQEKANYQKELREKIEKKKKEKHPGEVLINEKCSCCGTILDEILKLLK